jgi:hypothetical protein
MKLLIFGCETNSRQTDFYPEAKFKVPDWGIKSTLWQGLKVPKCEIFDRSDFHDFYTIKPFWVADLGAKILTCYLNF